MFGEQLAAAAAADGDLRGLLIQVGASVVIAGITFVLAPFLTKRLASKKEQAETRDLAVGSLDKVIERLTTENERLTKQVDRLTAIRDEQAAEIAEVRTTNRRLQEQIDRLQATVDQIRGQQG